jgi:ketosteroid isomerase-like protein
MGDVMTIQILEAFGAALNRRDLDAAMSHFAEDGSYQTSAGPTLEGRDFRGLDAVRAGLESFLAQCPDGRYEDASFFVAGDRGIGEWTFVGTSPDGRPIRFRGCDLYEFAGDKIKRKNAFRKQQTADPAEEPMNASTIHLPGESPPAVKLRQPYRPRHACFLELWRAQGWLIKLYGIAYEGEAPAPATVEAAKRAAAAILPQPARTDDRYGVAVVIVHEGQDARWLSVDWWGDECVLHHRPMMAPLEGEPSFRSPPRDVTACVWELRLLMFERDGWVATVLSGEDGPDVGRYLEHRFNGWI